MDMSKFKDGSVYLRNSGVKWLGCPNIFRVNTVIIDKRNYRVGIISPILAFEQQQYWYGSQANSDGSMHGYLRNVP